MDPSPLPPAPERHRLPVFSRSKWGDTTWHLDGRTPGTPKNQFDLQWNFELPDGSRFHESRWDDLRGIAKLFLWCQLFDPPQQCAPLRASSAKNTFKPLRMLIQWMVQHGYTAFTELDQDAYERFMDSLATRPGRSAGTTLTNRTLIGYRQLLDRLYLQGQRCPELRMEEPFPGEPMVVSRQDRGQIPATPDAVAIPLITGALRLIEIPAGDVIALQQAAQTARSAAHAAGRNRWTAWTAARQAVSGFTFATIPGESAPWYPHQITGTGQISGLVERLRDAAFVLITYLVGLRASEVLGLRTGCVEPCRSDALPDGFVYLHGRIRKTSASQDGDPHRWIAPPCIARAIEVLEALSIPWRARTGRRNLWLSSSGGGFLGPAARIDVLTDSHINKRLNDLFAPFLDLPAYQGKPWKFSTHQGRVTFASFVGRRDPTSLDALRAHYGHRNIVMTRDYIRDDPELGHLMDKHARKETKGEVAKLLTATVIGGPAGRRILEQSPFRGRTVDQEVLKYVRFVLEDTNLVIGICDWGICLYRRETSKCHGDNHGPNPVYRSESTCVGCLNFAALPEHRSVWEARRERNSELLRHPGLDAGSRSVAQARIAECDRILAELA